jgi:hypothetical protein
MGSKLIRGETIYFVRQAGRTSGEIDRDWLCDDLDGRLLPPIFVRSDGYSYPTTSPVVPVEVRTFENS